jgi:phage FluMu protein Com
MCPRCKSLEVTRSRTRVRDTVMMWLGMKPYRCRECNKRFHLPAKQDRSLRLERARRAAEKERSREVPISSRRVDSVN